MTYLLTRRALHCRLSAFERLTISASPARTSQVQRAMSTIPDPTTAPTNDAAARVIGSTQIDGVDVPPMAIGTWSWGDTWVWKHKDDDLGEIREAWGACIKHGLTFYDTAEVYGEGKSEKIIGDLRRELDESERKKLYIATKYLPFPRPANFFLFNPGVVAACRKSLARLGVDQIDLYQVHANRGLHSIESVGKGLAECVKLGLARSIGVSNYSLEEMIQMSDELEKHGIKLASNQVEFSLLRSRALTSGLKAEMDKRGIKLLAYSPLGMGRLTGKYSSANPPPKGRRFGSQYTWEQLDPLIEKLKSLSEKYNVTPSAIALNWVICQGAIPLGGARNAKQAGENAKALGFRLDEGDVEVLTGLGFEGKTSSWQHD